MNYLRNLIIVSVVLCFYICDNVIVKASDEEYKLRRESIPATYYIFTEGNNKKIYHMEFFRIENRVVYCLTLSRLIGSSIYSASYDFGKLNLSNEDLNYVQLLGYYGYEYGEHSKDYKYYLAAQELIWEKVLGGEIVWTNEISYYGEKINIESYKEEIVKLVENYLNLQVSFDTISGIVGEKVVLEKEGISDYEVISSGNQKVFIEGNKLVVELSSDKLGDDAILFAYRSIYGKKSTLYTYGTSQRLFAPGSVDFRTISVDVEVKESIVKLQRVDSESGLAHGQGNAVLGQAEYDLYKKNGELVAHLIMDESGGLQVEGLEYGEYYLLETRASVGYELNKDKIFFMVDDSLVDVLIPSKVIKNEVELFKKFGDMYGVLYPEEGAVFFVYDNEMNFVRMVETDSNGLGVVILPYGNYIFKQVSGKEGYSLVDDFSYEVSEVLSNSVRVNLFVSRTNFNIRIIASDSDSGEVIISDSFKYRIRKADSLEYYGDGQVFISNDGKILVPYDFEYGDYVIEIVEVDADYFRDDMEVRISVNNDSIFSYEGDRNVLDVWVTFNSYTYNLLVKKTEEVLECLDNSFSYSWNNSVLSFFELYANDDIITKDNYIHYKKDDVVSNLVTNELGEVSFFNLEKGEYCLREVEIDSRYLLDDNEYCFYLDEDKKIEVENYLKKGNLVVSFLDYYSRDAVSLVELEIFDENNNSLGIYLTDENGQVNFEDIPLGEYSILVKSVVYDYKMIDSMIEVSLDVVSETEEILIFLEKEGQVIAVPNTFHNEGRFRYVGLFMVFLIGVILVVKYND